MHRVHQEASAHQNLPVVRPRERPVARRYANSLWLAGRDNLLRILSKGRVFTALESDEGRFALSYHGLGSAEVVWKHICGHGRAGLCVLASAVD